MLVPSFVALCLFVSAPVLAEHKDGTLVADTRAGGVKSLEKRVKQLEAALQREVSGDNWYDRISFSGLVEVEAGYQNQNPGLPDEAGESSSDLDLAAVEFGVDARISELLDAHVLLKWEEDELFVDEGFIALGGGAKCPSFLIAGRQYLPFGYFVSHFITDPTTLVLGETNSGALIAGTRFAGDRFSFSLGVFNGRAKKTDDESMLRDFVVSLTAVPFDGLDVGAAYNSNLAASDGLADVLIDSENMGHRIDGLSLFVSATLWGDLHLIGEYVAALDQFEPGDIYAAEETQELQPVTWSLEAGYAFSESWELAGRYGGSKDGGADFLPEEEFGAVLNWSCLSDVNLALEYVHGDYRDGGLETDSLAAQLAVEF